MKKAIAMLFLFSFITALSCCREKETNKDVFKAAETVFKVDGMVCTGCETSIKKAVEKMEGVKKVEASYKNDNVHVYYNDSKTQPQKIAEVIKDLGYNITD